MHDRCRAIGFLANRFLLGALLVLVLPFAAAAPSEPAPRLRLLDSDPGQDVVLRGGEPLYLRLRYQSAIPIHILVSGYHRGDVVRNYRQDSEELFPAGDREATVWLAYPRDAKVDQVRIRLWNANKARVAVVDFPFEAAWSGAGDPGAASRRATKSWVAKMTPGQRERMAETSSVTDEPGPCDLIFLCVPGYLLLQAALTFGTSGRWRKATLAPAVVMVPILVFTVLAFAAQSNLWPLSCCSPLLSLFSTSWS